MPGLSRRSALCAALCVPASVTLSACGSGGDSTSNRDREVAVAAVEEIDIGGGTVTSNLVIVRPEADTIRAFDRTCPHQGSYVVAPVDGVITCPSHGSRFDAENGEQLSGPATTGLTEVPVRVDDGEIYVVA